MPTLKMVVVTARAGELVHRFGPEAPSPRLLERSLQSVACVLAAHGLLDVAYDPEITWDSDRTVEDLLRVVPRDLTQEHQEAGRPVLILAAWPAPYLPESGTWMFAAEGTTGVLRYPLVSDVGRPPVWWHILRAAVRCLFPEADPGCGLEQGECLTCGPEYWEWFPGKVDARPSFLCAECRARLDGAGKEVGATRLARLAQWVAANPMPNLRRVRGERLGRIASLCQTGSRGPILTNAALIAHAEQTPITTRDARARSDQLRTRAGARLDQAHASSPVEAAQVLLETIAEATGDSDCAALVAGLRGLAALTPRVDCLLHATTKRGRDHSTHMAATALFCQFFGDTVLAGDSPADEQTVADKALTASSLLYSQWCLAAWTAALFHDTAYPLQELTRLWYLAVPHPGAAPAGIYYADELRRLLHAMAQHVGGRLRRAAARAVGDLVLRLLPRPGSLGAADDLVARLQTELEDLGLASRLVCPDLLRELLEPAQGDDRERPFRLTNHGVLSALICVAALRGSLYLDPNPATTPEWLRWALQAMVVHDFEIDSHTRRTLQRARADRAPVVARGARRWFDFRADPVSFMLRLADKVHHWERVVRGDFELTQECKEIALEGLLWRLQRERQGIMLESGRPRWVGPPRLVLIYDEEDKLEASGWEHKKLHDDLRKYLAELPFPNDWGLPGPRPVTLRFRATLPEVVPKPDNAARNA